MKGALDSYLAARNGSLISVGGLDPDLTLSGHITVRTRMRVVIHIYMGAPERDSKVKSTRVFPFFPLELAI